MKLSNLNHSIPDHFRLHHYNIILHIFSLFHQVSHFMFFGFWIVLLVFEIKLYMIKLFDSHVQESCCKSWNLLQTWDKMAGLLTTRRQSSPLRTRHQQQRPGSPQVNKCQRSTYSHQDFVRGRKCWLVDSGFKVSIRPVSQVFCGRQR